MRTPTLILGLLATLASTSYQWAAEPSSTSDDWPQWRGPNRDNISSTVGISTDWEARPPVLAWKMIGMGTGYASVSISGDRLYTTGNQSDGQAIVAVDLTNHSVAWSKSVTSTPKHGYDGSRCTPSIDGDRLYVVTSNGQITCLKSANGAVVWEKDFQKEWMGKMMSGWGFSESPLIDGDHVLCTPGGANAMVVCLDKMTGNEVWRSAFPDAGSAGKPGAGYSSLVISEGAGVKQYVTLIGRGLIGVRASDGKLLWHYNRIANHVADIPTPVVQGDYVFGSSGYDTGGSALLKLVKDGNGVKYEEVYYYNNKELQNHHGQMILYKDHLYFGHGHNRGFPVCVELTSGKIVWGGEKNRGPGEGSAAVTLVDGHIIFRYQKGPIALVEATPSGYHLKGTFTPAVQVKESWSQPVVVRGKLYLREQDQLMCYDLTK